jgi:membrane-associated phospholipid phosphatase
MPALGPFIFENSKLTGFTGPQQYMLRLYTSLRETGLVPAGYFTSAPAAMPSLHTANSLFFLIMAVRAKSVISVLYILVFIFILIVAVASKWHYVIDLPAGALLTFAVVFLVDRVFPEPVER